MSPPRAQPRPCEAGCGPLPTSMAGSCRRPGRRSLPFHWVAPAGGPPQLHRKPGVGNGGTGPGTCRWAGGRLARRQQVADPRAMTAGWTDGPNVLNALASGRTSYRLRSLIRRPSVARSLGPPAGRGVRCTPRRPRSPRRSAVPCRASIDGFLGPCGEASTHNLAETASDIETSRMVPESGDGGQRGCLKCGHTNTEVGTISTTGGGLSKMFDIQTNSFKVVSCTNCGYSELYRDTTAGSSDIVDIFLG